MSKDFFLDFETMKKYALSYNQSWYIVASENVECDCKKRTRGFKITDRKSNELIQSLVHCSDCWKKNPKNRG